MNDKQIGVYQLVFHGSFSDETMKTLERFTDEQILGLARGYYAYSMREYNLEGDRHKTFYRTWQKYMNYICHYRSWRLWDSFFIDHPELNALLPPLYRV